jgi:hypothetical protein
VESHLGWLCTREPRRTARGTARLCTLVASTALAVLAHRGSSKVRKGGSGGGVYSPVKVSLLFSGRLGRGMSIRAQIARDLKGHERDEDS